MAQEMWDEWGGAFATITRVILGYASMVAYTTKSGEIPHHLVNLPESVSGVIFTAAFTLFSNHQSSQSVAHCFHDRFFDCHWGASCSAWWRLAWTGGRWQLGTRYQSSNLVCILVGNIWCSLSVLCAYLDGDLVRVCLSGMQLLLNSSVRSDQVADPVELLMSDLFMVEAFSLLAVGTSLIGTLLGFSEFFKEQVNRLPLDSPSTESVQAKKSKEPSGIRKWWERNRNSFTATTTVVAPSLRVSTTFPDAITAAMTLL
ncbi:hypothetical protein RJ641_005408 [Dillenia turbinata]|uniref:Transmembrane protein n=1 Tax=Dillenia turbinata TaxID=194707 RepID=A0AAN8VKA0_9MAGN